MDDRFILRHVNGGEEHELSRETMLIGRHKDCDIVISKGYPSRKHARFQVREEQWFIEDLDSTNGTFVNNRRIQQPTRIRAGDVVKFGSEAYYFLSSERTEQTIISGKFTPGDSGGSSFVTEEEPGGELTSIQQSFPLPPGWSPADSGGSRYTREAIDKLLAETFAGRSLPDAALIFYQPQRAPLVYGLTLGKGANKWAIGRRKDCQVRIDAPSISGLHAHLVCADGRWSLIDAKSTNGIRCNGVLKTEVELEDGAAVTLGHVDMVLRVTR